ncbi:MAG: DNA/RNA nuclease SfsA [Pseudomonadota bacterium]
MRLPNPLTPARLVRRYKRFLADARLEATGEVVTAHIANSGSMMGLKEPDSRIWLSRSDNPKRKLAFSWELCELPEGGWSGVSTANPNRIVEEALRAGRVAEAADYREIRREVAYGKASRVDFLATREDGARLFIEVKNVHLRRVGDLAEFPDSVTARGAKHLEELGDQVEQGDRALMLYVIQRTDCARFALAADLDPDYVKGFRRARARGVEAVAYKCDITPPDAVDGAAITLSQPAPIEEP